MIFWLWLGVFQSLRKKDWIEWEKDFEVQQKNNIWNEFRSNNLEVTAALSICLQFFLLIYYRLTKYLLSASRCGRRGGELISYICKSKLNEFCDKRVFIGIIVILKMMNKLNGRELNFGNRKRFIGFEEMERNISFPPFC